jgi:hypothetical protein
MASLFGNKDDMKQVGEDMQKLSEQIGALQQQLSAKSKEADSLRSQLSQNAGNPAALQQAQAQIESLRSQLAGMQQQQGTPTNDAALQQAHSQIQALQQQLTALQQQQHAPSEKASQSLSSGAGNAAGGLSAGASAWVTRAGGLPLRMRSGPGLNQSVIDRLQPGTQMTLQDGPRQSDGHAWWHIRTTDGREGWVAGEDLRTQPD